MTDENEEAGQTKGMQVSHSASSIVERLQRHPYSSLVAAFATVATLIGFGIALGLATAPDTQPSGDGPAPGGPVADEVKGVAFGRLYIDGRSPTDVELSEITVVVKPCDSEAVEQNSSEVVLQPNGSFVARGLSVGPEEISCLDAIAKYKDDKVSNRQEVNVSGQKSVVVFDDMTLSLLPPGCQAPDESLAIRFIESPVLSSTARADAAQVAIDEIRATGGRLVLYDQTTSIGRPPERQQIEALKEDCVDALVTHLGSGESLSLFPFIATKGIIQFSPNSTSPELVKADDGGLFFRTAPSDATQGRVLARSLEEAGKSRPAVIYLEDTYGKGLKTEFEGNFEGGEDPPRQVIDKYPFQLDDEISAAEIDLIIDSDPDAIVIIGYDRQSAEIVELLNARNYSSSDIWLVDGNAKIASELEDPNILKGVRQTIPGNEVSGEALTSLRQGLGLSVDEPLDSFVAQTYDAVIILALAAAVAEDAESSAIADKIVDVTRGGTKCFSYAECLSLIGAPENIDYDGVGGPYDFTANGEPYIAIYRVDTYGNGGQIDSEKTKTYRETLCEIRTSGGDEIRIDFDEASSVVSSNFLDELNQITDLIKATTGDEPIVIEGYASTSGTTIRASQDVVNGPLSKARAEAVKELLVQRGIAAERLETAGLGATSDFLENRTVRFRC